MIICYIIRRSARAVVWKKILMLLFNIIFWATGVVILAVGVWTKRKVFKFLELSSFYQPEMPFVIIAVGVFIILVGGMACCCTVNANTLMIYTFACFLFLIFIIEFVCGIVLIINREQIMKDFKKDLTEALYKYGSNDQKQLTFVVDELQAKLLCCGTVNYKDWFDTPFSNTQGEKSVPASCCQATVPDCNHSNLGSNTTSLDIHSQGCYRPLLFIINSNLTYIGWIAVTLSFFQVLGVFMAIWLVKSVDS